MTALLETSQLEERAALLVEAAKTAGADKADAIAVRGSSLSVDVRNGAVEEIDRSEGDDFTLRVFVGDKTASVSTNAFDTVREVAERAVSMAKFVPDDPYAGFLDAALRASVFDNLDLVDGTIRTAEELTEFAREAEDIARSVDGVTASIGASASWGVGGMALVTSDGFSGSYLRSRFSHSASVIAGEGTSMERDGDYDMRTHASDLRSPADVGKTAGERTVKRLNPSKTPSTTATVVYENRVASSLLGHLASAINGAAIARGTSFLKSRMGEQIFRPDIQISDQPRLRRRLGSRPFDGEGGRAEDMMLVADGILTSWTLDSATARELGLTPNGRASRGGSGTSPSTTNLTMLPGTVSFEEAIAGIENGILVTDLIGQGTNLVTGDYSRGAAGFKIENGKITTPVSEITIAGNLTDMFARLVPCNDLEIRGSTNAPSIVIDGMTIAGT